VIVSVELRSPLWLCCWPSRLWPASPRTPPTRKAAPGSVFAADKGKFNILLDGASIGREEFEVEPSGANWIAKGSTSPEDT